MSTYKGNSIKGLQDYARLYKDMPEKIKVLMVCHGNICRSTMAQSVLEYMVKEKGIAHLFEIDSAATSREEIGNTPHYGTVDMLRRKKIPVIPHRARQMTYGDYEYYDYLIGMDTANIRNMTRIANGDSSGKIYKLLGFVEGSNHGRDVADPWYTDNFDVTYEDVNMGCIGFLDFLRERGLI